MTGATFPDRLKSFWKLLYRSIGVIFSKGDTILAWVTVISIPIGGWWAYHNFSIRDTASWNPQININAEVFPYDGKELIVVHVRPKNIGKVPIELKGKNHGDISVSLGTLPLSHGPGRIKVEDIEEIAQIESFVAENSGEYDLEPGVEYNDVQYFVVPKPKATKYYVATAELDWPYTGDASEGYNVEASTVITVKP